MPSGHAVQITEHEVAQLVEQPIDDAPLGPREIAGRTLATVLSPGTEINSGYRATDGFPRKAGYAAAFEVQRVGDKVTDAAPGDRFFCMGPHRTWQRVDRGQAAPLPPGLDPHHAPFARLMGVSMTTLTTTAARPGDGVAVTGLGLVGHLAAQIFTSCGYRVTGCDPDESRRALATEKGIAHVMHALPVDVADEHRITMKDPPREPHLQRIRLVVECSGHEAAALGGCNIVERGGEVVLIGAPWAARTDHTAHQIIERVFSRFVHLRSGWEWELPMYHEPLRRRAIWDNLTAALDWLARGRVDVAGLYDLHDPGDIDDIYRALIDQRTGKLTAVLDWTSIK